MDFKRYSSIDNANRIKTVNYIMETGNSDGEWVLTLKIHGANYSLWCDGISVKHAKRSGFIEGESFYGDLNFDYDENAMEMFKFMKKNIPTLSAISIQGEIYGGFYNHPDVERAKSATRVQKEVQYRPDNDFIVFDIKLYDKFSQILPHDIVIDLCADFGFTYVPVLATGKFVDLMKFPVKFPDPLCTYLGLPEIDDNNAEGWVLKPVEPKFFKNGERIILKGKNPEFNEKNGRKAGKPPKPVYELSKDGNMLKEELSLYINENRLRNVISYYGTEEFNEKSFGKLLGFFCKDAFDDFLKDFETIFNDFSKKEQIIIKKIMNRVAGDVIRPNFRNIIDGEF